MTDIPHPPNTLPSSSHLSDKRLKKWIHLIRAIAPGYVTVILNSDTSFGKTLEKFLENIDTLYDTDAREDIEKKEIFFLVLVHPAHNPSGTNMRDIFIFYGDMTSLHIEEAFTFEYGKKNSKDEENAEDWETYPHYYVDERSYLPYICSLNRICEIVQRLTRVPTPPTTV